MDKKKINSFRLIAGILTVLVWALIIWDIYHNYGIPDIDTIIDIGKENKFRAFMQMESLFLMKGLGISMHTGLLYSAVSVLFPFFVAIGADLLGIWLMVTPQYLAGRFIGEGILGWLVEKYPKLADISAVGEKEKTTQVMLIRMTGFPLNMVSLYCGAIKIKYGPFLMASLPGLIFDVLCYSIVGYGGGDSLTLKVVVAMGSRALISVISVIIYYFRMKNRK